MFLQITLLIILFLACCTIFYKKYEHFFFIPQSMRLIDDEQCTNLSRYDCKHTANCGYCTMVNGDSMCIPGDWNGPRNGQDCVNYEYGTDYANLSLVAPPQPYWVEPNRYWNWTEHLHHDYLGYPQPMQEGNQYFRHSDPPQQHHKKIETN